mmetsp:Transcript_12857/g.32925  ORF Transcript_12857/g.32925 Transcript_12857/m.32925 type:complete len:95 (-) Transcript_12857:501-785(-)|eukprot:CAMPEP_0182924634 /NCGR_PEP_ID=MMETSP0105_2-20130417/6807_1 /TAXON_ID=81532 ORGANISM="Acanthoeca-like sp., Strain 10tr" /NCGR_SAMPLE_ID=MMETSP0105_2 /ASSEMBLY_ACC=CAM_ASM_000205 /LENGTH=94 /DNA_ID=CAMNT_0025062431 /DNA_START=25 /DNA_END=309 /DNA_ORIENTATION=-
MAAAEGAESNITSKQMEEKLTAELPATFVQITDTSANRCGSAFEAMIVSEAFEGKKLLQRHRLVNKVLQTELETIHAFSQKTLTPTEYEGQSAK